MTLIAIFFPWAYFFISGQIWRGLVCLVLQLLIIGWIPAAIWAVSNNNYRKTENILSKKKPKELSIVLKPINLSTDNCISDSIKIEDLKQKSLSDNQAIFILIFMFIIMILNILVVYNNYL